MHIHFNPHYFLLHCGGNGSVSIYFTKSILLSSINVGFTKKLTAASNDRDCEDLRHWIKSASNHMYWSAVSTPAGKGEITLAKWKSLVNHVTNVHDGHGDLFPSCAHGSLEGREAKKKWLKPSKHLY